VLGKETYLNIYREDLESEARWLEYGAEFKANSIEELLKRHRIEPETLLELGSGTGAVIRECQRRGLAREYIGIDASEDAVSWARERSRGIRFLVADITSPECELPRSVDVVVLSHVLEHLEHPRELLAGIAEVPLEDLFAARVKNLFRDRTRNVAGHVQFFTEKSFRRLMESAGFEIEDSLRYFAVNSPEMLQWQLGPSPSPARLLVKRLTQRALPRLLMPLWVKFYHSHVALLCRRSNSVTARPPSN
jgi:SAM-dependent methyltransferase